MVGVVEVACEGGVGPGLDEGEDLVDGDDGGGSDLDFVLGGVGEFFFTINQPRQLLRIGEDFHVTKDLRDPVVSEHGHVCLAGEGGDFDVFSGFSVVVVGALEVGYEDLCPFVEEDLSAAENGAVSESGEFFSD